MPPKQHSPGYANIETGEVVDFVPVPRYQSHVYHSGGFFMGYQEALARVIDSPDLTDGELRVLFKLLTRLEYNSVVLVNVSELAREMSRDRSGVSRSLKALVDRGVLLRGPKMGRTSSYMLNPELAFVGSAPDRARAQRIYDRRLERGWEVVEGDSGAAQDGSVSGDQALPGL